MNLNIEKYEEIFDELDEKSYGCIQIDHIHEVVNARFNKVIDKETIRQMIKITENQEGDFSLDQHNFVNSYIFVNMQIAKVKNLFYFTKLTQNILVAQINMVFSKLQRNQNGIQCKIKFLLLLILWSPSQL
ncbi:EF-hand_domain pair [Hexamita inflata]|uniref:EF-hand_domain pair n=1 Tax=Hexamita inflata TaxID=28002 RepID=A0ABP1GS85_9EUKA